MKWMICASALLLLALLMVVLSAETNPGGTPSFLKDQKILMQATDLDEGLTEYVVEGDFKDLTDEATKEFGKSASTVGKESARFTQPDREVEMYKGFFIFVRQSGDPDSYGRMPSAKKMVSLIYRPKRTWSQRSKGWLTHHLRFR